MCKVNICYDSVEKTLAVDIDGEPQTDISSITVYNYGGEEDESHIELVKVVKDEENDMIERTSIYASHKSQIKEPALNMGKLVENLGNSLRKR